MPHSGVIHHSLFLAEATQRWQTSCSMPHRLACMQAYCPGGLHEIGRVMLAGMCRCGTHESLPEISGELSAVMMLWMDLSRGRTSMHGD